jgi:hypothetical protein
MRRIPGALSSLFGIGGGFLIVPALTSEFGCNRLPADPQLPGLIRELHQAPNPQSRHWRIASRGLMTHILSIIARLFAEHCEKSGESAPYGESASLRACHRSHQ